MKFTVKLLILLSLLVALGCTTGQTQLVSPGGIVNLFNDTGEPIEVFVDGSRFAVVDPGQPVLLDKILSGRRLLSARGVDSGLSRQREFDLAIGEAREWRVERFGQTDAGGRPLANGAIDVVNTLDQAIDVEIPGMAPRPVSAGVTIRITGIEPGLVSAIARVPATGAVFAMDLNVKPGVIPAFTIALAKGAVRIANRSGRKALINTSSHAPRLVEDGQAAVFDGLAAGIAEITVVDMANRPLAGFQVDAVPGKVIDLVVNRPAGILKMISDLERDVSVYADGILIGSCPATGGATIQGLVTGRNHVRAVDSNGETAGTAWIEIGAEPALWLLGAGGPSNLREGMGAIKIVNPAREQVSVFVDGVPMGPILAGASRIYPDVVPGEHQVAVIGVESNSFATAAIMVAESRTPNWKVTLPGASLAVRNTAAEPANVYADGRHIGVAEPGATTVFPVPEGPRRIDVSAMSGASSITRNLSLPADAVTTIVFSSQFVTLVATNQFTDPVEVRIDERILGVLNPGERVTVSDVRPGSLSLTATSTIRPVSMTTIVSLDSGDAFDWFINP